MSHANPAKDKLTARRQICPSPEDVYKRQIEALKNVDGIKEGVYAALSDLITVD